MGRRQIVVGIIGVLASVSAAAFAQAPAAKAQPAATPAPTKFVTPYKGEAKVEILAPQSSQQGGLVVTKVKVKNTTAGPLVGFKVDEYWYSAKGTTVSGSPTFRHPRPFMPGEIIEVTLRSPKNPDMARVLRVFAHGNGSVKPTQVAKFKADS